MTQQSHSQAYTLKKPKLKETHVSHCSLEHSLQQLEHGSNLDVHRQMNGQRSRGTQTHGIIAMKRNTFESVLMGWMNLEPIIQSEISQKEKDKYHILMHISESRKMVLKNLFTGQQWGSRHREQTYGHGERGGEGEMFGKSNMETYITMCKIDSQWEFAIWLKKLKLGLCINLEEQDGAGDGREVQKGRDICIPMADSL